MRVGLERINAYLVSLAKKLNSSNFSIIKILFLSNTKL